jgi:hypothetical protein
MMAGEVGDQGLRPQSLQLVCADRPMIAIERQSPPERGSHQDQERCHDPAKHPQVSVALPDVVEERRTHHHGVAGGFSTHGHRGAVPVSLVGNRLGEEGRSFLGAQPPL